MREILVSTCLLLCLATTGLANEPQAPMPVGTPVLAKRPDVQFRIKKQAIEAMPAATVFDVRQQQGEWLWLARGWVRASEVVRVCDAVEYFGAEIERRPTAFAHTSRGTALARRGDSPRALADAEKAIELDPTYPPALACRAERYYKGSDLDLDRGMGDLDEAIRLNPRYADAYLYRGGIWLVKEVPDRALKDFDRAIELSPRMAAAYTFRGRAWISKGDWQRGVAEARQALKLDSRQAMAHVLIGAYEDRQENYELARLEFDEAIRINPRLALARLHRGRLNARSGEYHKALVDLNLAVQLLPKRSVSRANALEKRSYVYYRLGATEKASADRLAASRERPKATGSSQAASMSITTTIQSAVSSTNSEPRDAVRSLFNGQGVQPKTSWLGAPEIESPAMQTPPVKNRKLTQATPLNNAAWRMSTSTDERYLNGLRAIELATEACELTEWKRAAFLETLAAAYAEAGDFEAAIRWQTEAIELLVDGTSKKSAEERLESYRDHRPYRVN